MNKENLLPRVSPDIGHSLAQAIEEGDDKGLVLKELSHVNKHNPAVAEFISKWSKMQKTKEDKIHSALCGLLVYRLLESQAEVDAMEREFKLG